MNAIKRFAFATALALVVMLTKRAEACQSFGQASGCWLADPCFIQGNTGSTFEKCGGFTSFDANGREQPVNCPTTCAAGMVCGAQACDPVAGCSFTANQCFVTCSELPNACGQPVIPFTPGGQSSGWTISCGGCPSGETCFQAACCTPATCAGRCGSAPDDCGGTLSCGNPCSSGQVCSTISFSCCQPATCPANSCGLMRDGCGGEVNCGPTPAGDSCINNQLAACTPTTCNPPAPAVPRPMLAGFGVLLGLAALAIVARKRGTP